MYFFENDWVMGQKGTTNVFWLSLEKYVELSRDAKFRTVQRLQWAYSFLQFTIEVVNVQGSMALYKHVTLDGQVF